jgi:GH15 family glucan-1,4-alpha-glucosidase
MPPPIEDYALLGDTQTGALVSKAGSIDWLCLPRFDSAAPFASLLGDEGNGRWQIAPFGPVQSTRRRYRGDTLVLETDFDTAEGSIRLADFMPLEAPRRTSCVWLWAAAAECACTMDVRLRTAGPHPLPVAVTSITEGREPNA